MFHRRLEKGQYADLLLQSPQCWCSEQLDVAQTSPSHSEEAKYPMAVRHEPQSRTQASNHTPTLTSCANTASRTILYARRTLETRT
jgi:hypothetical protein